MTAVVNQIERDATPETTGRGRALLRRHRWSLGGLVASVVVMALVLLASLPTGAPTADRTVPAGARLAARAHAAHVEVLVISKAGTLSAQVAYQSTKGWLSAPLEASPSNVVAAWTGTKGDGPIPALAIVYGRAPGRSVRVVWADGKRTTVRTASDGVYVVTRDRYVRSKSVRVLDASGATVLTIEGP